MTIPTEPAMTEGGSAVQLCCDLQSWLLWASLNYPSAPAKIRKEYERRAALCGLESDDPPELSEKEVKPMAAKAKKKPAAPAKDKQAVAPPTLEGAELDLVVAKTHIRPTVTSALIVHSWNSKLSVEGLRGALAEQIERVATGDMLRPENILLCQAHTLDFLFSELAQQAKCQQQMPNYEAFMRLALRAQNQCRCTLETLANIKNPPVVFAKQANISQGHQQINNNGTGQASHAGKNEKQPNELLLEDGHHASQTLDTRTTAQTSPINSELEAVENGRR